jgi:Flp pilus assembly pilin Flp
MRALLQRLAGDDSGQSVTEYGIALAVIAGAIVLIAVAVGPDLQNLWHSGEDVPVRAVRR